MMPSHSQDTNPLQMTARIIDGKALAAQVRGSVKPAVERLAARGVQPGLTVIIVGDDAASHTYVRNKIKACADTGVRSELISFRDRNAIRAARPGSSAER
jgi:5,10-methylene-tetrahydrofolate dehydrogenase/methenyl tetrahydrofolate cyclohydrolase